MESLTAQSHHLEIGSETLESMVVCTKSEQDRKPRPSDMQSLKCPRCDSTNTKFCYYNNYSLSQPRYFCKSCRRYWTKGGTLRNVPVGGGCRKNKRSSSSSSSSSTSSLSRRNQDNLIGSQIPSFNPNLLYESSNDLTLAIARLQKQNSGFNHPAWPNTNPHGDSCGSFGSGSGLFETIRNGFLEPSQSLYYGMGNVEMGMGGGQEDGIPFEDFSVAGGGGTTVKQEMCGGGREGEGRVLWGFPWQSVGGDGNGNQGNWNGSSGWHGLLNSPLM